MLLNHGANPNQTFKDGHSLLYYVKDDERLTTLLLNFGADPNIPTRNGFVPIETTNPTIVKLLFEHGANPNYINSYYNYPVFRSILYNDDEAIIELFLKYGANPNILIKDNDRTILPALSYAIKHNKLNSVGLLLLYGAEPNVLDRYGKYPYEYATKPEMIFRLQLLGLL